MKHLVILDVNQAQRDDLIARLQNVVPGTNGLYRIVLNATETQRLTTLRHFFAVPAELADPTLVPTAESEPTPDLLPDPVPVPGPIHEHGHHGHHDHENDECTCHHGRGCKKHRIYPQGDSID